MRCCYVFSLLLLLVSCDNPEPEITNLRINHYQQTGIGEEPYLAYLVQEGNDIGTDQWTFQYDNVTGFDYELGYVYDLNVRKAEVENPPTDGSSVQYMLEEVISKEKVAPDISFSIDLKPVTNVTDSNLISSTYVTGDRSSGFRILDKIAIDCADLCTELSEQLHSSNTETVIGTFQHADGQAIRLIDIASDEPSS